MGGGKKSKLIKAFKPIKNDGFNKKRQEKQLKLQKIAAQARKDVNLGSSHSGGDFEAQTAALIARRTGPKKQKVLPKIMLAAPAFLPFASSSSPSASGQQQQGGEPQANSKEEDKSSHHYFSIDRILEPAEPSSVVIAEAAAAPSQASEMIRRRRAPVNPFALLDDDSDSEPHVLALKPSILSAVLDDDTDL